MATKRKMVPPLTMSLYHDLDIGSTAAENAVNSTSESGSDPDSGCSMQKKSRNEGAASEQSCRIGEDDGAVGKLVSVCGWRKGERQDMQDAHVRLDQFGLTSIRNIQRSAFYAIFDGHAGRRAADFAAERLPPRLKRKLEACSSAAYTYWNVRNLKGASFGFTFFFLEGSDFSVLEKGIKKCFIDTYKQVDEQFLVEARRTRPSWKDGTTATTILLVNNVIYCANIGDSKAVVCRSKFETEGTKDVAMQLTVDHSPLHFEERMRIQKAGGNVKDGRIMGILEVSRSIGDGQFKAYGLICIPDVKKFSITKDDIFVLIACDGLWKTFSNQEAVDYVIGKIRQSTKAVGGQEPETREMIWQSVADDLAAESVKRGCGDNVSVIIVVLNDSPNDMIMK
uniref:PPM-type phosphatase domain-containing protein n=1 Tax=Setaria digitata TaxID=48799 RepID=A0A915Q4H7_9BILA